MTEPLISQVFCCVADLVNDMQAPGGDEALLYQRCRDASDYLQKEIGAFIPVLRTLYLPGSDERSLLIPPVLSINSLVYQGLTLVENTDYLLRPEKRRWPNGPYTWLEAAPYSAKVATWCRDVQYSSNPTPVMLTGLVGLYNRSVATGAKVDDASGQTNSQTTLQVDDGSKVGPGMQLLIESEQQLVSGWGSPIDSAANTNGAIAITDETITLDDGTKVNVGEVIRIEFEQMKIRDKQTNQIYVKRGWNRTTAADHTTGKDVYAYRAANVERGLNGTTAASHAKGTAISRYMAPDDILFLAKEIATLMINKSLSQYQGRTGNAEGVIFYNDAFPKQDIERIKALYSLPEAG